MTRFNVQPDIEHIGEIAASLTIQNLSQAIKQYGNATWVLAGGTAPMTAYKIIADRYKNAVDWSRVTVIIGDERCVPLDDPDSNWQQIAPILFDALPIPAINIHRPKSDKSAEDAAADYADTLTKLPKTASGLPRLDIVWLGMGEDGHTLSLFPHHPSLQNTQDLVVPVHNSPKPPSDRISLTLRSLQGTANCIVMAAGASKTDAIKRVKQDDANLPIVQAILAIQHSDGIVMWLVDNTAYSDE